MWRPEARLLSQTPRNEMPDTLTGPEWPSVLAIKRAIQWNHTQQSRAQRDASRATRVPRSATRRVYRDGRPTTAPLTLAEYRDVRASDALRFAMNMERLAARL